MNNEKLRDSWWASQIYHRNLFYADIKSLNKAQLMKINYILELGISASSHRILIIDKILMKQYESNPFIIEIYGEYVFNKEVDFWSYINRAKKYS